jgi:hypothetical protein
MKNNHITTNIATTESIIWDASIHAYTAQLLRSVVSATHIDTMDATNGNILESYSGIGWMTRYAISAWIYDK